MAFFKFRKGGDEPATPTAAPESIEAIRTRAKHRLIGAAVLVLAGVIGFPLLFDNQPRPVAVDIPIEIPDKARVKPLTVVPPVAAPASVAASGTVSPSAAPTAAASVTTTAPAKPPAAKPAIASVAPPPPAAAPQAKPVPAPGKPAVAPADAAKAQALLDGKEVMLENKPPMPAVNAAPVAVPVAQPASAAGAVRYIVQVGAYADVNKAREARQKLERAGMKTYTQVVNGAEGKRIRVRIGPFENKAEADKAADKVKKLDLPAAILEL